MLRRAYRRRQRARRLRARNAALTGHADTAPIAAVLLLSTNGAAYTRHRPFVLLRSAGEPSSGWCKTADRQARSDPFELRGRFPAGRAVGPGHPTGQRGLVDPEAPRHLRNRLAGLGHDPNSSRTELRVKLPSLARHDSQLPLQSRSLRYEGKATAQSTQRPVSSPSTRAPSTSTTPMEADRRPCCEQRSSRCCSFLTTGWPPNSLDGHLQEARSGSTSRRGPAGGW